MIIGIDARPMQGETRFRGIGKALERTLVPLFKNAGKDDSFVLFYDPTLPRPEFDNVTAAAFSEVRTPKTFKKKYVRVVFRRFKKITNAPVDVDVFLQFDFSLGIPKNVPSVTMFHDLIPILFRKDELLQRTNEKGLKKLKQAVGGSLQWRRYTKDLSEFKNSERVLAISESSRRDLLKFYPEIPPSKVTVAHLGVTQSLRTDKDHTLTDEVRSAIASDYLLYVGGIDTRKNIVQLVKDFYRLKKDNPNLKLVVVGKEFGLSHNLKQLGWFDEINKNKSYADSIISLGYVSDYELEQLYANAVCFVFPSLYEGFGLPILEAMAFGCPTVAYKNSSIIEIAGDAGMLVENGQSMSGAIEKVLTNPKLRKSLKGKGLQQIKLFSWDATARTIYSVLKETAENEQR